MANRCVICERPIEPQARPETCGTMECPCIDVDATPCVCSSACEDAVFMLVGKPMAIRRKVAGIELWRAPPIERIGTEDDGELC
jgi:hypothetical protein